MAGPQVRGYLRIQASIKVAATSFHEALPIGRKLAAKVLIHPGPSASVNAGETKGACVYGIGNWKKKNEKCLPQLLCKTSGNGVSVCGGARSILLQRDLR